MEENNIKIYGSSHCSWCKKQLEEFNNYVYYVKNKGLYVDCALEENKESCKDIQSTPTWKQGNEIFKVGFLDIKKQ